MDTPEDVFVSWQSSDARCAVCGEPLTGDPDDQPDWPGGPLDGECYRAREFDQTLWEQESS